MPITEKRGVCAKMMQTSNRFPPRIGGGRHVCMKSQNHEGECGKWKYVSQPEHAKLLAGKG